MNDLKKEDINILLRLIVDDVLSFDDVVQYFQAYIQKFGALDDDDPLVKQFLKKIGRTMNKPEFTQEQKDFICWQIGEWYLMMKPLLEDSHNLGYMKEKLKTMVCGDDKK